MGLDEADIKNRPGSATAMATSVDNTTTTADAEVAGGATVWDHARTFALVGVSVKSALHTC